VNEMGRELEGSSVSGKTFNRSTKIQRDQSLDLVSVAPGTLSDIGLEGDVIRQRSVSCHLARLIAGASPVHLEREGKQARERDRVHKVTGPDIASYPLHRQPRETSRQGTNCEK
jgi:hypothetical protein